MRGRYLTRRRRERGIRQGSDLGEQVEFEECRMQLYDLPVFRRQRLDVDRVCQRRIDVYRGHDFRAIAYSESGSEGRVDLDGGYLLLAAARPAAGNTVTSY